MGEPVFTKTRKMLQIVGLVNQVDTEKFEMLLDRIIQGLQTTNQQIFTEKELL
jgi:hypothetical protein